MASIWSGSPRPAAIGFRAAKLGYVFQTFNLLPAFTALENVLLGMTFSRGRRDVVASPALARTRGPLATARTTSRSPCRWENSSVWPWRGPWPIDPQLLLADEPTANVDPANQQRIIDLIRETAAKRTSPC